MNERLLRKNDLTKARRIKQKYRIVGGSILAIGLSGIIACMIAFIVLFLHSDTETALTAWLIAIPFIIIFVCGSVITRIGDQLLKKELAEANAPKTEA